jgi:hypothetical protein
MAAYVNSINKLDKYYAEKRLFDKWMLYYNINNLFL